uniref:Uncharacterized protein n=1 Tax=Panagrolaimus sp. PS1159 TaxID=55785 RepID=A0AC35F316_9BILA
MIGSGIDLNENELKKQSSLNLKSQKALIEIFGNVTDYLKKNSKNLDENDFEISAKNILSISDDISSALGTSFSNPLESFEKESLINFDETFNCSALGTLFSNPLESAEKESLINFDETFNWLPPNPADNEYYFDEKECQKQATLFYQKEYAKQLIYSMNAMISAVEDVKVEKILSKGKHEGAFSYSVSF